MVSPPTSPPPSPPPAPPPSPIEPEKSRRIDEYMEIIIIRKNREKQIREEAKRLEKLKFLKNRRDNKKTKRERRNLLNPKELENEDVGVMSANSMQSDSEISIYSRNKKDEKVPQIKMNPTVFEQLKSKIWFFENQTKLNRCKQNVESESILIGMKEEKILKIKNDLGKCANQNCEKSAQHRCSRCKSVRYCSSMCAKITWHREHKNQCKVLNTMWYDDVD